MEKVDREERKDPGEECEHFLHEAAQETGHSPHPDKQQNCNIEARHARRSLGIGQNPVNDIREQRDFGIAGVDLCRRAAGRAEGAIEAQLGRLALTDS